MSLKTATKLRIAYQIFADEIVKGSSNTQAAITAGYSSKSAHAQACRLLKNADIRAYIDSKSMRANEVALLDAAWVRSRLMQNVDKCMNLKKPVMVWDADNKCMKHVIGDDGEPVYEHDSAGANKGLELLGKHLPGFFNAQPEDAGNIVQWIENKTYIDARSQHVHNNTIQPTPTPQQLTGERGHSPSA